MAVHVDGIYTNVDTMTQSPNINTPITPTGPRPQPTWGRHPKPAIGRRARISSNVREAREATRQPASVPAVVHAGEAAELRYGRSQPSSPTSTTRSSIGAREAPIAATVSWRAARTCCPWTSTSAPSGRCARRCRSARAPDATSTTTAPPTPTTFRAPPGTSAIGTTRPCDGRQRVARPERARSGHGGESRHQRVQPLRRPRQQGRRIGRSEARVHRPGVQSLRTGQPRRHRAGLAGERAFGFVWAYPDRAAAAAGRIGRALHVLNCDSCDSLCCIVGAGFSRPLTG